MYIKLINYLKKKPFETYPYFEISKIILFLFILDVNLKCSEKFQFIKFLNLFALIITDNSNILNSRWRKLSVTFIINLPLIFND